MWMVVRDNASPAEPDGSKVLAACPDTDDRGEAWRWSVRRVPGRDAWSVEVDADPAHVRADRELHRLEDDLEVHRAAGEEIVVVPITGRQEVSATVGPWRRWLAPGDVFVLEGEQSETIRLRAALGAPEVAVVRLRPTSDRVMRWVP